MQNKTTIHIILCGLLTTSNIIRASESPHTTPAEEMRLSSQGNASTSPTNLSLSPKISSRTMPTINLDEKKPTISAAISTSPRHEKSGGITAPNTSPSSRPQNMHQQSPRIAQKEQNALPLATTNVTDKNPSSSNIQQFLPTRQEQSSNIVITCTYEGAGSNDINSASQDAEESPSTSRSSSPTEQNINELLQDLDSLTPSPDDSSGSQTTSPREEANKSDSSETATKSLTQQENNPTPNCYFSDTKPQELKIYPGVLFYNLLDNSHQIQSTLNEESHMITITIDKDTTEKQLSARYAIIYKDEKKHYAFDLNAEPTKASLIDKNTIVQKTPEMLKYSLYIENNKNRIYSVIGGLTFVTLCMALAYHYNKLPDAFVNLLEKLANNCKNVLPGHFYR